MLEKGTLEIPMDKLKGSDYGLMTPTHEYPDPDYAAYITKYPWREDDGYLPSALHGLPSRSLKETARTGNHEGLWKAGEDEGEVLDNDAQSPAREVARDPDYQVSEADVT